MLTTDSSGRVIRWVPLSSAVATVCVLAFVLGVVARFAHARRPAVAALQATREELARTRTECKQALSITEELITQLEGWMQFAHATEHLEGAD